MDHGDKQRIFLGTAQLVNAYGAVKLKSTKSKKQIFRFLDYAVENGINKFDAAPIYNSEDVIGEFIKSNKLSNIKISTKIPLLPTIRNDHKIEFIKRSLHLSQKKIKTNIYTLFLHDEKDSYFFLENINKIENIKREFGIKHFGLSVYSSKILNFINKTGNVFAIQFPYNFANTEIITVKKSHILFARSIFLQGLLLNKEIKKKIPKKLILAHTKYFNTIKTKKLNPLELCVNYAFNQKRLNYLVVGCDNIDQLRQLLNSSTNVESKDYNYYKKLFNIPEAHEINF